MSSYVWVKWPHQKGIHPKGDYLHITTSMNNFMPLPWHSTVDLYMRAGMESSSKFKVPDRCAQLFDRECYLITEKHKEVLDCIPCVMVFFLSTRHAEPIHRPLRSMYIVLNCIAGERTQTDGWTAATKRIISLASRSIKSEMFPAISYPPPQ